MKKATLTILGIATLLLSLTLNFKHALNDYGILDNKLHVEVLAQSNSSGDSDSEYRYQGRESCTLYKYKHISSGIVFYFKDKNDIDHNSNYQYLGELKGDRYFCSKGGGTCMNSECIISDHSGSGS